MPMQTLTYDYKGVIGQDNDKFHIRHTDVLCSVFSAGNWGELLTQHAHLQPIQIGNRIGGYEVEINYQQGNLMLRGGYYYQNRPRNGCHGLIVIFLSGSGGPAMKYGRQVIKGYLSDPFNKYVKGVLCVDYRGFGLSRPVNQRDQLGWTPSDDYLPTLQGLYADTAAMIDFATHTPQVNVTPDRVIVHGYSLGSGLGTEIAKQNNDLGGLVLHGPIKNVQYHAKADLAEDNPKLYAKLGSKVAGATVGFRNAGKIKDINIPICITCGPNDTAMWPRAKELKRTCEKYHKYYRFAEHGGGHFDTSAPFRVIGNYDPIFALERFLQHVS